MTGQFIQCPNRRKQTYSHSYFFPKNSSLLRHPLIFVRSLSGKLYFKFFLKHKIGMVEGSAQQNMLQTSKVRISDSVVFMHRWYRNTLNLSQAGQWTDSGVRRVLGKKLPYCFLLDQSSHRNIILLRPSMWSVLGNREGFSRFIGPVSQNASVLESF